MVLSYFYSMRFFVIASLLLLFAFDAPAYELDKSFNPNITEPFVDEKRVNVVVEQADGKILIGGHFRAVDGVSRSSIARLQSNGKLDLSFTPPSISLGRPGIENIIVQNDGKVLVIGGSIQLADGLSRNRIIRLNEDGSLDEDYRLRLRFTDSLYSSEGLENGQLLLGLSSVSGGCCDSRIVRFNSDGTRDPSFTSILEDGNASRIEEQSDGRILINGGYEKINGVETSGIVWLDSDGSVDQSLGDFLTSEPLASRISRIAFYPDKSILIIGSFTFVDGIRQPRVARLYPDGSLDTNFTPDINSVVSSFVFLEDGKILIGGEFNQVDGDFVKGVALLNADGRLDDSFVITSNGSTDVSLKAGGNLYLNGFFLRINGVRREGLARLCLLCAVPPETPSVPAMLHLLLEE